LINALVPVAVYYIAKELFSKEVGMLGAVIVSFDQASIMHSVVLGTEALFTVLLAFAVLCVIRYFKDPSKRIYIFFTGALMGLCVITRYTLLLILFFIFITSLFIKGRKFRGKVLDMALITLTALLFISPITAINYSNTGRFYLVEKSEDRLDIVWYNRYTGREEMCPSNLRLVAIGFDPFKKPLDSALLIFKKPVKLIATCAEMWSKRLVNFFFWPNFGFSDPILLVNPSRFPNEFGSTLEFYLFVGYMIGLYKAVRNVRLDRSTLVIFMVFAYFIFIHVILFMFSTVRYRVPVIPCQAVVLAAGIYTVYLFLRRHWGER
jgi:4-amino-4-deoxy-L-arabinose transferase-like glycosyltransferase